MNQKIDTKLAARKSIRASGRKPMLDLLSVDVGRRRRSDWVCCDDCHKRRRISVILADSVESTKCRWYTEVFSKTKDSKKVYMLRLEREALVSGSGSGSKRTWREAVDDKAPQSERGIKSRAILGR
ncbi:unnamed protein product [Lactuca saligna]|uniref:CW-type domain-containing protein n=1 Tax=Lactuca saligna TaxID=75948 RepID=A0AA35YUW7_LACSI|nr:unnamed protein product [Lactuca saligna]